MKNMLIFIVFLILITAGFADTPKEIKVGGYHFPPYVIIDENHQASGVTLEFLKMLNNGQNKYKFVFKMTSPKRRFLDLQKSFDMICFEDKKWGWETILSNSFLEYKFKSNPELKEKLIISKEKDQEYELRIIIGKSKGINVREINFILNELKREGGLTKFLKEHLPGNELAL